MRKTTSPFLLIAEKINGAFPLSLPTLARGEVEDVDQV